MDPQIKMATKILRPIIALGLLAIAGCKEVVREESQILHEDAMVVERIYSPSRHNTSVGLTAVKVGGGFGMDYRGNMGCRIGNGLQISSSTVPEKYGVMFKCQHGSFTSQGSDVRHKNLYQRLKTGELVDVTYKEIYRTTYEDVKGTKKHEVIERVLVDFDFLDAQPREGGK
jgi:hypothetical protein